TPTTSTPTSLPSLMRTPPHHHSRTHRCRPPHTIPLIGVIGSNQAQSSAIKPIKHPNLSPPSRRSSPTRPIPDRQNTMCNQTRRPASRLPLPCSFLHLLLSPSVSSVDNRPPSSNL